MTPTVVASFSDSPYEGTDDVLERQGFVRSVVSVLEKVGDQEGSTVLGLIGSWGSGKSTIFQAVLKELQAKENRRREWIVTQFNPWYFQDLSSLQAGFFRELAAALPKGAAGKTARDRLAALAEVVVPFGALGGVVGVDATGMLTKASELIRGGSGIQTVKDQLEESLRKADRPVLVAIDDVDRLHPEELLLLFKLIRLAGRLPNVHYVLAYDEDTLVDALRRTGLIGETPPRRAIDYMEKIVQIRLDLPPLREGQRQAWVDREVGALAERLGISEDNDFERRWTRAYHGYIRARMGTPRAIKRYFAQVEAFAEELVREVDMADFLIISWIRASEPLLYRALIDNRRRLVSPLKTRQKRGGSPREGSPRDHWERVLVMAGVEEHQKEGVASLIGHVFPRFLADWSGTGGVSDAQRARVNNPYYFDRYFAFNVPTDDISDIIVERAAQQIAARSAGDERHDVEQRWRDDAVVLLTKLEHYWKGQTSTHPAVLAWLTQRFEELAEAPQGQRGTRSLIMWLSETLIAELRDDGPTEAVRSMVAAAGTPYFAARVLQVTMGDSAPPETRTESFAAARHECSTLIREYMDSLGDDNPLHFPPSTPELLMEWQWLDRQAAAVWASDILSDGTIPLIDLLASFVPARPAKDGTGRYRVGTFDATVATRVVGEERTRAELGDAISEFDAPTARDEPFSDDSRRRSVLEALQMREIEDLFGQSHVLPASE